MHPFPYPNILGLSFAGVVEHVGPGVKGFQRGDHVATLRPDNKLDDPRYGAFQQYALASTESTSKLSSETRLEAGAATILNLATVTAALSVYLGLDRASLTGLANPKGQKVLIYGGSSSSGGLATKYATAAGYDVVTTSSQRNRDFVASLGPSAILDHTKSAGQIVEDLRAHGPYYKILDTIGLPPVTDILVEYLASVDGGSYNTLIPTLGGEKPIPSNVVRKFESYGWVFDQPQHEELKDWFYNELVPHGLAYGKVIPTRSHWIDGGLEKTQHALNLMAKNKVSGHKLVMDPWK